MSYTHVTRTKGDVVKSDEWNAMGRELENLERINQEQRQQIEDLKTKISNISQGGTTVDYGGSGSISSGPLRHRMYPPDPIVYQDIFEAKSKGVIVKMGNPGSYNDTTYTVAKPWNGRPIIAYGRGVQSDGNGAKIVIPDSYDTLWVRVLGDRYAVMKAYFLDTKEVIGEFSGGWRKSNCYCPDGSLSDGYHLVHQWVPIPADKSGEVALISKTTGNHDLWLSGVAFSRNPWRHAVQAAIGYHWKANGTQAGITWNHHDWNSDMLGMIPKNTNLELKVPVLPSDKDKLLYIVEHNNNWNGCMHAGVTVNGKPIERLLASYDNPFARHWSSKFYQRYIAARIPKELVPGDARFLNVKVDMRKQDHNIHFREIGTHDMG